MSWFILVLQHITLSGQLNVTVSGLVSDTGVNPKSYTHSVNPSLSGVHIYLGSAYPGCCGGEAQQLAFNNYALTL